MSGEWDTKLKIFKNIKEKKPGRNRRPFCYPGTLILHFLFAVIVMIYIVIADYYQVWEDPNWLAGETPPYYKTRDYACNVENEVLELIDYMRLRNNFENDGEYAPDKQVDIFEYAEQGIISGSNTNGFAYTLQQLYDWSRQKESYKWWENYIQENDRNLYNVNGQKEVKGTLDELYAPQGFDNILEFVMSDRNLRRAGEAHCISELAVCLLKIDSEMSQYAKDKERFKAENTNIKYRLENTETGLVYTNCTSETVKQNSARIRFQGDMFFLDTDVPLTYEMKYDIIKKLNEDIADTENITLSVWIDRTFSAKDYLWGGSQFYDKWSWFIKTFPKGLIFSAAVFFISLMALCVMTVKSAGRGNGMIRYLDRISIEFLLVPLGLLICLAAVIIKRSMDEILPPPQATGNVVIVLFIYMFLLMGVLSIVRRGKMKTLCRGSIISQIIGNYRAGIRGGRRAAFALAGFVLYALTSCLLCRGGTIGGVILVFLNLYAGGHVLKEISARQQMLDGVRKISDEDFTYKIPTENLNKVNVEIADNINRIGDNLEKAVQESVRNERRKTDLIANVSHDLKTPLTSIISYIGLLKREKILNPKIEEYVDVLDKKTQRLKILMEDLVEVSRINSGNFHIQPERMDFREFQQQVQGEFFEQLQNCGLETVNSMPEEKVYIWADGRALWRVMENLYGNIIKYALPGSRVYADMKADEERVVFSLKNISLQPLNIDAEELTERFIQGDESRSTEGSGLGLSIAKNLVELMDGRFEIYLDGDLFKTTLIFPVKPVNGRENMEK